MFHKYTEVYQNNKYTIGSWVLKRRNYGWRYRVKLKTIYTEWNEFPNAINASAIRYHYFLQFNSAYSIYIFYNKKFTFQLRIFKN